MLLKPITTSLAADSANPLYSEEFYTINVGLKNCVAKFLENQKIILIFKTGLLLLLLFSSILNLSSNLVSWQSSFNYTNLYFVNETSKPVTNVQAF